jgi:predicted phosphate transport protein (TIGR00153 family)
VKAHLDRDDFQQRIDDSILVLFSVVAEAVGWATEALLTLDTDRARLVIGDDLQFDRRCEELTGTIKERLSQAPLRQEELEDLIAILQIIPELERSADLAEHIAQRALRSIGSVMTPRSRGLIEQMGAVVADMWRDAATAYRHRSQDASFQLQDADDAIDRLATDLVEEVISSNAAPQTAVDLGLLARFYERLGDHAVNLSRRIEFMSTPSRFTSARNPQPRLARRKSQASGGRLRRVVHALSRFRLAPTDEGFFELFSAAAENCRDCATTLRRLVASPLEPGGLVEEVKIFEKRGDELTTEILNRLDRSFITPFDREDIHGLGEELDDVVDAMLAAASLIDLAHNGEPPPELAELTDTLVEMADELVALVDCLPIGEGARAHVERIGHLERRGDAEFRHGMAKLLSGAFEPLLVIAWKDIIQAVEEALNSIEDASDVIEGILVKNS